jgi:hypothetical protein
MGKEGGKPIDDPSVAPLDPRWRRSLSARY